MNLFLSSYLLFYFLLFAIGIGNLTLQSFVRWIHPRWAQALPKESVTPIGSVILLAALFVPIAILANRIYPWAGEPPVDTFRSHYLGLWSFRARALVYFVILLAVAHSQQKTKASGSWMLVVLLFVSTFASFDWMMSLEPDWHSTAYGVIFFVTGTLLSFAIRNLRHDPSEHLIAINNVAFALISVWIYLGFVQFLVIWSGNLPGEVSWYLLRSQEPWKALPVITVVLQFLLPFGFLLFRQMKQSFVFTRLLAAVTVVSQFFYLAWLILPPLDKGGWGLWAALLPAILFGSLLKLRVAI